MTTAQTTLISLSELFRTSWNRYWAQIGTLLLISLAGWAVNFVITIAALGMPYALSTIGLAEDSAVPDLNARGLILTTIISLLLTAATTSFTIAALMTNSSSFRVLASIVRRSYLPLLLAGLLVGILSIAGFLALVIPGFIVLTRLLLTDCMVVVEKRTIFDAIQQSWRATRGLGFALFLRFFAYGLCAVSFAFILSFAPLGGMVSSVVISPFTTLILYLLYQSVTRATTPSPLNHVGSKE